MTLRRLVFVVLLLLARPSAVGAAVAYDNTVTVHGSSVTTLTTAGFVIAGTNRAAVVGIYSSAAITSITTSVGGVSGALVTGTAFAVSGMGTVLYGVIAPPTGSQTATANWTGSVIAALGVETAQGVNQATPLTNGTGATQAFGLTVSKAVTSAAGDLTATQVGTGSPVTTATSNQTKKTSDYGSMDVGPGTAGPITHTWTVAANQAITISCANFLASGGGAASPPTRTLIGVGKR
jgi:hypothetical protein